ncbi:hypothetical protein SDC9_186414 [bioreactor metagenome]|uniref:Uncharacterized protein n=1 Tax=bioreactor metagenome TaxID=1076179 RepID=A0A645HKY9_9ZZZZ
MIADAQGEFRRKRRILQGVLKPHLVNAQSLVAQAEHGEQPPFHFLVNRERFVFNGCPDKVVAVQPSPRPPAPKVQQRLKVRQRVV